MKFPALLLLLILLTSPRIWADEMQFGLLSPEDVAMKACSFEKDAPAVIIFDKGNSDFIQDQNGFLLRFKRHVRIKIFSETAFDQSEVEIPLYHSKENSETVKDIKGFTYNVEGGRLVKTPLNLKTVYKETINEYWHTQKFALPQIKEGSIIEYSYTVYSPFYEFLKDWEFQTDIPTMYSEYKVNMIPFFSYRYRLQGTSKIDHFKTYEKPGLENSFVGIKYKDMVYEFGLKNVPAFKDESFITSRNDYIKKIDFQLAEINYPSGYKKQYMESWPALAKELLDNVKFGKYIKKAEKWSEKNLVHLKNKPEKQRADEILNYIKKTYKWNTYYGKSAQRTFKEFNTSLTGNIGNINLYAIGALRAVGLKASPVIISTRNNGKVSDSFPYSNLFNYVLVLVEIDGKKRLIDASEGFCPNHLIPARCINGKGFIVEEDSEMWVNITNKQASLQELNLTYNINTEQNSIEGMCRTKFTGYMALRERQDYYRDSEKYLKAITDNGLTLQNEIQANNLFERELPFKYNFTFSQNIDRIDNQYIISPFAHLTENNNPFKQEERNLPIDLIYLKANRLIATIIVPENYTIESLPQDTKMNSENVAFQYTATKNNNTIQIIAAYQFKKQSYPANAYTELKSFMNTVRKKINAKIILIPSNETTI